MLDTKLDGDNPEHIKWLFDTASDRAKQFNITGVTYSLTQGVVKNIIPAIASTNALVAAACSNEAFKLITNSSTILNNYMMFMGTSGVYTHTFALEKNENCIVCGNPSITVQVSAESSTLQDFIDILLDRKDLYVYSFHLLPSYHDYRRLKAPSVRTPSKTLYMRAPAPLEKATRANLDKKLKDLLGNDESAVVTDEALPVSVNVTIKMV